MQRVSGLSIYGEYLRLSSRASGKMEKISYPFHIPMLHCPQGGATMATLLVVEDDRKTNDAICEYLTRINRKSYFAFPPNFKYNKEKHWRMCHVTYG